MCIRPGKHAAAICYNDCAAASSRRSPRATVAAFLAFHVGEWLSLVEHLVRDQGVGGSNPLSPTNVFQSLTFS